MNALADMPPTRRTNYVQAEPTIPPNWSEASPGTWHWTSTGRTVTASIFVREDCTVSAPAVSAVGKMYMLATELERVMVAVQALLDYVRARAAWQRVQGGAS